MSSGIIMSLESDWMMMFFHNDISIVYHTIQQVTLSYILRHGVYTWPWERVRGFRGFLGVSPSLLVSGPADSALDCGQLSTFPQFSLGRTSHTPPPH